MNRLNNLYSNPIPFSLLSKKYPIAITRILCETPHLLSAQDLLTTGCTVLILEQSGYSPAELLYVYRTAYRYSKTLLNRYTSFTPTCLVVTPLLKNYLLTISHHPIEQISADSWRTYIFLRVWHYESAQMVSEKVLSTHETVVAANRNFERIVHIVVPLRDGTIISIWGNQPLQHINPMLLGGFILQNIDQPHQFSTCCATELADGRVATGAGGGPSTEETIKIWDLSTGECVRRLGYVGAESVSSLIQLQDHRYLASGQDLSTGDGSICIWDIDSGYRTHRINLDFGALEKLFSLNDGALGYLGLHPGDFYISRNRYYMEAVHGYDVPDDDADDTDVVSVCVLSDGATVACGLADGRIRLVDVSNNSKKNMDGTATNEKRSVGRSKFPITDCRNKKIVHYIDAPAATAATVEEGHDQHNESTEAFSDAPVQSRTSSPPLPVTSMCVLGDGKTLACVRSHTVRGVLELELELYDFQQVKDKIR